MSSAKITRPEAILEAAHGGKWSGNVLLSDREFRPTPSCRSPSPPCRLEKSTTFHECGAPICPLYAIQVTGNRIREGGQLSIGLAHSAC